jgi:hypothetical protein
MTEPARSSIAAAMLNPALVATILATTATTYRKETGRGLHWALAFVVVPMVLHRGTREALPGTTTTHLAAWVSRNPRIRAALPARAHTLVATVRAGLRFGLTTRALTIEGDALIGVTKKPRGYVIPDELEEILGRARFLGRWLAKTDSTATIFALLGVAP